MPLAAGFVFSFCGKVCATEGRFRDLIDPNFSGPSLRFGSSAARRLQVFPVTPTNFRRHKRDSGDCCFCHFGCGIVSGPGADQPQAPFRNCACLLCLGGALSGIPASFVSSMGGPNDGGHLPTDPPEKFVVRKNSAVLNLRDPSGRLGGPIAQSPPPPSENIPSECC